MGATQVTKVWILGFAASLTLSGCASMSSPDGADDLSPAPVVEPADPAAGLLRDLASLPAGQPVTLGDEVWLPGRLYSAASGRQCRTVEVRVPGTASEVRLACRPGSADGAGWDWYPVVTP